MRLYPAVWNGISGFLDDMKTIQEKVTEELSEELGIPASAIVSIRSGPVLVQEATEYNKVWLVTPVLAEITTTEIKLDWEASEYRWVTKEEAFKLELMPGYGKVMEALGV
jgi:isopentenyldiphosphate isomerase